MTTTVDKIENESVMDVEPLIEEEEVFFYLVSNKGGKEYKFTMHRNLDCGFLSSLIEGDQEVIGKKIVLPVPERGIDFVVRYYELHRDREEAPLVDTPLDINKYKTVKEIFPEDYILFEELDLLDRFDSENPSSMEIIFDYILAANYLQIGKYSKKDIPLDKNESLQKNTLLQKLCTIEAFFIITNTKKVQQYALKMKGELPDGNEKEID